MRATTIFLICTLLVLANLIAPIDAQALDVLNDAQFDGMMLAPWGDQPGEPDYVLHFDPIGYSVNPGASWLINDGVVIALDATVEIQIQGRMASAAQQDGNPAVVIRRSGLGFWNCIRVVGDGDRNNANGIVEILGLNIEGGGNGMAPLIDDPDYRGMIVLDEAAPVLRIGLEENGSLSSMHDSFTNGIVVVHNADGYILEINDLRAENPFPSIPMIGVKVDDWRWDFGGGGQEWLTHGNMMIRNSIIRNCGAHGVAVYMIGGDVSDIDQSTYDLIGDTLNDNGVNNPIPPEGDGGAGRGCGAIFMHNFEYGERYKINIIDCHVRNNSWDGLRLDQMTGLVHIDSNLITENERRGIYYDFTGNSRLAFVENCSIAENSWEGIFVQSGTHGGVGSQFPHRDSAIKIRGNKIIDNADNTADFPGNIERVANIRIHGGIKPALDGNWFEDDDSPYPEIRNNLIKGAKSGISIERLDGQPEGPEGIDCRNNIQFGANYQG